MSIAFDSWARDDVYIINLSKPVVCIVSARQISIAIAAMSMLRSVCQLRVGVTTQKPCLHPSILFSFSLSHNTHTLTLTSFPRTFRFHPPSLPLSPFVPFMPPKATGPSFSANPLNASFSEFCLWLHYIIYQHFFCKMVKEIS